MRRPREGIVALAAATLLAAAGLAACPLPQPLPEVSRVDGGTITPPRILVSSVRPPESVILVSTTCPAPPQFELQAAIEDLDTTEQVEARWFVDYDAPSNVGLIRAPDLIPGTDDPSLTTRAVPSFLYSPDPTATVHVVEVVVSNGFAPNASVAVPLPNRMPAEGFETQLYRWVFRFVDGAGRCGFP
jgi:hypothetical protein